MKFTLVLFSLFFGLSSACEICNLSASHVRSYIFNWIARRDNADRVFGLVQSFLNETLGKIEGEKKFYNLDFEIDEKNRFTRVAFQSAVEKTFLDMQEKDLRLVDIRNLTVPLRILDVRGLYAFDDLLLPGGLSLYGRGNFTIHIDDLSAILSIRVKYFVAVGRYKVENLSVDASVKNSTIVFGDLMDGEPLGELLNEMMNGLFQIGIGLVHDFVEQYNEEIKEELEKIINSLLGDS